MIASRLKKMLADVPDDAEILISLCLKGADEIRLPGQEDGYSWREIHTLEDFSKGTEYPQTFYLLHVRSNSTILKGAIRAR